MKLKSFFILIVLSFAFAGASNGQNVGNYLNRKAKMAGKHAENRADQNVNKKINNEVDKSVDNAFNKLWGDKKKKDDENQDQSGSSSQEQPNENASSPSQKASDASDKAASNAMMKAMGISTNVDVKGSYDYSGNIVMTIQEWDENDETEGPVIYTTYVSKGNEGFAMKFSQDGEGSTTMIFDYKDSKMIIMNNENGDKTGMVMQWDGMSDSIENFDYSEPPADDEIEDFSKFNEHLKKTGRSKKIAGYKCDEYIYDDEESHADMWMTDELPPELWANMFSANAYSAASMGFYGGFVMQMDSKEKATNERTTLLVNEVNRNKSSSISTSGYQFISMNSKMMQQQQQPEEGGDEQ